MSKADKTLEKILSATADANIRFDDVLSLMPRLGIKVLIDVQPAHGIREPYQVRKIRDVLIKFNIAL